MRVGLDPGPLGEAVDGAADAVTIHWVAILGEKEVIVGGTGGVGAFVADVEPEGGEGALAEVDVSLFVSLATNFNAAGFEVYVGELGGGHLGDAGGGIDEEQEQSLGAAGGAGAIGDFEELVDVLVGEGFDDTPGEFGGRDRFDGVGGHQGNFIADEPGVEPAEGGVDATAGVGGEATVFLVFEVAADDLGVDGGDVGIAF